VQNNTLTEVELQIEPRPGRLRIQRTDVNERPRTIVNDDIAAISRSAQQIAPAVETPGTDPLVAAEGFNAQAAVAKSCQQRPPFVPAAPRPIALPASDHRIRSRPRFVSGAIVRIARSGGRTPQGYRLRHGINVRRLYEARRAGARSKAERDREASAFVRIKLKPRSCVSVAGDEHQPRAVAALVMQARLGNGVILSWTHDASCGAALADLIHTLAGLPCSA
jgi:hypothetical protein